MRWAYLESHWSSYLAAAVALWRIYSTKQTTAEVRRTNDVKLIIEVVKASDKSLNRWVTT